MKRRNLRSFRDVTNNFSNISDFELFKRRLIFTLINQKILTKIGSFLLKNALTLHLPVKYLIKNNIYKLFCGGENLDEVQKVVEGFDKQSIGVILDYGAERATSQSEADLAYRKILETIDFAALRGGSLLVDFKISSLIDPHILEKKTSGNLTALEKKTFEKLTFRLNNIAETCSKNNVAVMIDAEETWIQDSIDKLAYELMRKYNRHVCVIYNTIQMYRQKSPSLLGMAIDESKQQNYILGVKLVRGAYMEKERERAKSRNQPSPIWNNKLETDAAFDLGVKMCLSSYATTRLCCASHNELSVLAVVHLVEEMKLPLINNEVFFAQLMGMSDQISYGLADWGYKTYKYVPYGRIKDIMPYLLRRAEENTSVAGQSGRELQLIKSEVLRRNSAR